MFMRTNNDRRLDDAFTAILFFLLSLFAFRIYSFLGLILGLVGTGIGFVFLFSAINGPRDE